MLSDAQQAAGAARLSGGKLTAADAADLLAAFRLWLGSRAGDFPEIESQLASATGPVAEKQAGVLILLKGMGFSTTKLAGGSLGIVSAKGDKRMLMIEYAFGLLGPLPGRGPIDNIRPAGSGFAPTRSDF